MAWTEPAYSKSKVDRAGRTLVDPDASVADREVALVIVDNWRQAHSFPLNTFQVNLRQRSRRIDRDATVVQRLKRLPSIEDKLERLPHFALSRIQDLGGCRAVVDSVDDVREVVKAHLTSRSEHELKSTDDYLDAPRKSGYRSVHLVYRYVGGAPAFNGLLIEIQVRTRLQHAWATAVEAVGTFTKQPLKAGRGDEAWLRFFALMATVIAHDEQCAYVPETPDDISSAIKEVRELEAELHATERMRSYARVLQVTEGERRRGTSFILDLNVDEGRLEVLTHRTRDQAQRTLFELEASEDSARRDIVLVSADDMQAVRTAYPNYFLDTSQFVMLVRSVLG